MPRNQEPAEGVGGAAEYVIGQESTAFGGRAVRVSIFVQGDESEIEKILTKVVRALAGEGGSGAGTGPGTSVRPENPDTRARTEPEPEPQKEPVDDSERIALEDLTSRETQVLDQVARGYDNATIARHLGISTRTVRNHLNSVFSKLNVAYRPQAVVLAREAGLGRR